MSYYDAFSLITFPLEETPLGQGKGRKENMNPVVLK